MTFVDAQPRKNWPTLNPRVFAREYFKRFDFIRELAALVAEPDWEKSYGLSGKALWVTEFGIPTKKLGKANALIPKHWKIFIYDRASGIPDGVGAIVWEDKWDAFFEQVSATFLHTNHVEAFLIYTLRETLGNETNDANHSNFSLYTSDWSGRLDAPASHLDEYVVFDFGALAKRSRFQAGADDYSSFCKPFCSPVCGWNTGR